MHILAESVIITTVLQLVELLDKKRTFACTRAITEAIRQNCTRLLRTELTAYAGGSEAGWRMRIFDLFLRISFIHALIVWGKDVSSDDFDQ